MVEILVIAPYPGLKDMFLELNETLNMNIHIEVGNLSKGLAIAKSMEDKDFDVIISRGATARLLRNHCSIPVVEVKISGYDILRTLTLLKGYPGKIGLISYLNVIQGADLIASLMDMNLSFFLIDDGQRIEDKIQEAIAQDIQVFIGDVISTSVASDLGLKSILITSGKEAVWESINDAEQVAVYSKKEKERIRFLEAVNRCHKDGMVAVNHTGEIQIFNPKAGELLDLDEAEVLGKRPEEISSVLYFEEGAARHGESFEEVVTLSGEEVVISKNPIKEAGRYMGSVAFLQPAKHILKIQSMVRNKRNGNHFKASLHFNHFVAGSEVMKEKIKIAKNYSKNNFPVLLYGEQGTGKSSLAQAIHNASDRKEFSFVSLNCEDYNEEELEQQLLGIDGDESKRGVFEMTDGGTLFIDSIGKMPLSLQAKLINILKNNKVVPINGKHGLPFHVRLITANAEDLKGLAAEGAFRKDLLYLINTCYLDIPPLRERKEDIDEWVRWFIATYNTTLGKQIVGIRPEVMLKLKEANWPGNIRELESVVKRMCVEGNGPFIEYSDVSHILGSLFKQQVVPSDAFGLNISGKTMEQLEREIILQVLSEENQNQSSTAKRLGINRATLWRKVKNFY
jgi:transcriptional regulator with PAS, ATPase and Fis domain